MAINQQSNQSHTHLCYSINLIWRDVKIEIFFQIHLGWMKECSFKTFVWNSSFSALFEWTHDTKHDDQLRLVSFFHIHTATNNKIMVIAKKKATRHSGTEIDQITIETECFICSESFNNRSYEFARKEKWFLPWTFHPDL